MKIKKITIAITNTIEMVEFYNTIFDTQLTSFNAYGSTLYKGIFCGLEVLMCPNKLAGVVAQQNRQQFDIEVSQLEDLLIKVTQKHGTIKDKLQVIETNKIASVIDPDGNTIVLIEKL